MTTMQQLLTTSQLENYRHHVSAIQDTYAEGSTSMVFEGAESEGDGVHLQVYNGRRSSTYANDYCYKPVLSAETYYRQYPPFQAQLIELQEQLRHFQENYNPQQHGEDVRIYACYGDVFLTFRYPNMPLTYPMHAFQQKFSNRELRYSFAQKAFQCSSDVITGYMQQNGYTLEKLIPKNHKITLVMGMRDSRGSYTQGNATLDESFKFQKIKKSTMRWCSSEYIRANADDADIRFAVQSIQWVASYSPDELTQYLASPNTRMLMKDNDALGNIRVTPEFCGSITYVRSKSAKFYYKELAPARKFKFAVEIADIDELQDITSTGEFKELIQGTEISVTSWPDGAIPDFSDELDKKEFAKDMLDFCVQFWFDVKEIYNRVSNEH